jgi:hypothetical protein
LTEGVARPHHASIIRLLACALLLGLAAEPAQAGRRDPVVRTVDRLAARDAFTAGERAAWKRDWRRARRAVRRLDGDERANLAGVMANTRSLARRGRLAGRARPAFLTLRHNLAWFGEQRRPTPANGTRRGFGSDLVWQLYAGSGWQLQPLGTFGALNALLKRRRTDERIRRLADEVLALAVWRRGFLAVEYLFPWGGGAPGWVSGMTQATGMQALAGAAVRLGDPRLMEAARQMRGAFETAPPWGVRRRTGAGRAHYLLYSQSPRLLVGNGFAQAILGLDVYRELSGDPRAARLVERGLAQARRNLPRFDTGAWSLYHRTPSGPGHESDLHYHRVLTGFLERMCDRFGERRFCRLEERFTAYEDEPVQLTGLRARARGRRLDVRLRVSKRSLVTVTVRRGGRTLRLASRHLLRGGETFRFSRPRGRGRLAIEVQATSLTGVASDARVDLG